MRTRLLAEFATPDAMLKGMDLLRERGYRDLETYSPYPIAGAEQRLRGPRSWLPRLVFAGGLLGALLGYGIQWYANVRDYPHNVGGRPIHAVPAFIPITFETMVLGAALTAFVGLLALIGLPALWHPVFEVDGFDRATSDRYWVEVQGPGGRLEPAVIEQVLEPVGPLRVVRLESES